MCADVSSKTSDQIISELLQTIHCIGSGTSDSGNSSSNEDESVKKLKIKKERDRDESSESSSKHKRRKKRKKHLKKHSSHKKKSKRKRDGTSDEVVNIKRELVSPERVTVKQEPSSSPVTIKKEPEVEKDDLSVPTETENVEDQPQLKVAEVFVEDLLESGEKTLIDSLIQQPSNDERVKTSIKITDLKKCNVLELAEEKAKEKAAKYEEGEITDSSSDDDDLDSVLKEPKFLVDSLKAFAKNTPKEQRSEGKSKIKSKKHKHKSNEKRDKRVKSSSKEQHDTKKSKKRNHNDATIDDDSTAKRHKKTKSKESKLSHIEDKPVVVNKASEDDSATKKSPRRSRSISLSLSPSPEPERKKMMKSFTPPPLSSSRRVTLKIEPDKSKDKERSPVRIESADSSEKKDKEATAAKSRAKSESRNDKKQPRGRSTSSERLRERRKGKRRSRSTSRSRERSRRRDRDRRSRSKHRSRSRSRPKDEFYIDKTKLLEIARKNALSMMKHGHVRTDLSKVTITAGGKTVDELTDFCKLLSEKEARGQDSVSSDSSDNDEEKPFHHPFQLKERPNSIVMNIRNCNALPVKSHLEKTTENAQQLRLQFPVSSGQHHRKTESEWIPVEPKKPEIKKVKPLVSQPVSAYAHIPLPTVKPAPQPVPPVGIATPSTNYDIAASIGQKLEAIRRQQEAQAAAVQAVYQTMQGPPMMWHNMDQAGLFTGSTGARVLTQAELASGQQAWAKKDQLMCAQPLSSGMGMSLLQKMGWNPGEGLGKNKEGTLEPLTLQVKMDKRGLVCAEEQRERRARQMHPLNPIAPPPPSGGAINAAVKAMESKHPVSLLVEYCTRRHYPPPVFDVFSEEGPPHKKSFIFKVTVNGIEFRPMMASPNKKLAKAEAATICLRKLGILAGP